MVLTGDVGNRPVNIHQMARLYVEVPIIVVGISMVNPGCFLTIRNKNSLRPIKQRSQRLAYDLN